MKVDYDAVELQLLLTSLKEDTSQETQAGSKGAQSWDLTDTLKLDLIGADWVLFPEGKKPTDIYLEFGLYLGKRLLMPKLLVDNPALSSLLLPMIINSFFALLSIRLPPVPQSREQGRAGIKLALTLGLRWLTSQGRLTSRSASLGSLPRSPSSWVGSTSSS